MALNKQSGNMYPFVTDTWNTIKGKCPHDCVYCYMKRFKQGELRLDGKEFKTDLGEGNFIFVGSSCDMWAWVIPEDWIKETLAHCCQYPNTYLFQSKNPDRFKKFYGQFPDDTIFGTTIETNRTKYINGEAPSIIDRYCAITAIGREDGGETMVTIEPIMDFDLTEFVEMLVDIEPEWINVGADSQRHNLPEPESDKILNLIDEMRKFTEVKIKKNLNRLLIA